MVRYTPALLSLFAVMAAARSSAFSVSSSPSTAKSSTSMASSIDTPETLPEFASVDEYLDYMNSVSQLPKGFATGTSDGTFISVEAPGLGNLKIRATVIQLTEGPTDNWAACFTSNKVREKLVHESRQRRRASIFSSIHTSCT